MEKQRLKKHHKHFYRILKEYYENKNIKKRNEALELFENNEFSKLFSNYNMYIEIFIRHSDPIENNGFDKNMISFAEARKKIPKNHYNIDLREYEYDDDGDVSEYTIIWEEIKIKPLNDSIGKHLAEEALAILKVNDKDSIKLKEIEEIINNKIAMDNSLKNKVLLNFHIGKGGKFNNPGCLKFLGYGLNIISDIQVTEDIDIKLDKDGYNNSIDGIYNTYYGVFVGNQSDYLDLADKEKRYVEDYLEGNDNKNIRLSEYFAEMNINTNIC